MPDEYTRLSLFVCLRDEPSAQPFPGWLQCAFPFGRQTEIQQHFLRIIVFARLWDSLAERRKLQALLLPKSQMTPVRAKHVRHQGPWIQQFGHGRLKPGARRDTVGSSKEPSLSRDLKRVGQAASESSDALGLLWTETHAPHLGRKNNERRHFVVAQRTDDKRRDVERVKKRLRRFPGLPSKAPDVKASGPDPHTTWSC
jgi:hypothetical protein